MNIITITLLLVIGYLMFINYLLVTERDKLYDQLTKEKDRYDNLKKHLDYWKQKYAEVKNENN